MTETAERLLAEIWELDISDRYEIREELLKSLAAKDPKYAVAYEEAVKARLARESQGDSDSEESA